MYMNTDMEFLWFLHYQTKLEFYNIYTSLKIEEEYELSK